MSIVDVDPITMQVVRLYLDSLTIAMSTIVERSAMHPLFNEVHDYSTGVFLYDGDRVQLISMSLETAVPNHIIPSALSVEAAIDSFGVALVDGDIVLLNDPYCGGTHTSDWTMMTPVSLASGAVIYPTIRAHMADSGGPVPSGYNPSARDVWQEGFRITPLRLVKGGNLQKDVLRLLLRNTRIPTTMEGDIRAIVGACEVGARKTRALIEKYGDAVVERSMLSSLDYSERRFRAEIERWPDGVYRGSAVLDHDSAGGRDVLITCTLAVSGSQVVVDFAGSSAQSPGNVNSPFGNTSSAVCSALCTAMPADIPVNSGLFRAIDVIAAPGSIVNPIAPMPVMLATAHVYSEIGTAVMKALEQIVPDTSAAIANAGTLLALSGVDDRYGEHFVTVELGAFVSNAGGAKGVDGWGGWPTPSSAIRFSTIEMLELQLPLVYHEFEYSPDSAAPGQWRGVPAFSSEFEATSDLYTNLFISGVRNRPPGWMGGGEGAASRVVMHVGTAHEIQIDEAVTAEFVPAGDRVRTFKGGGGGWGDPFDRAPEAVLGDVLDGIYTADAAEALFGVAVEHNSASINWRKTRALRAARRGPGGKDRVLS